MRKLTKASLSELAESKEIISFREQKSYVGGGSGTDTDPYTQQEFETIVQNGNWTGGWVLGLEEKNGELSYTAYTGGTDLTSGYIESYNGKTQIPEIQGCGNINHPYTEKQFNKMFESGTWNGGFVQDMGYVMDDCTSYSYNPNTLHLTGVEQWDFMYKVGFEKGFRAGITETNVDDAEMIFLSVAASTCAGGDSCSQADYDYTMIHLSRGFQEGLLRGREAIGKGLFD